MRRVFDSSRSLLFKPLSSQGVCEPLMSKSYARSFDQTYELTYEHSSAKVPIRNISRTTDQAIISNQNTLVAKQNETQ
ncbi:hypothetical protein pdam_00005818 [Pocillopora damicornis]|uniref:Uncharacterized protein n=1 Tax=Pocillopora damicornis TaxID=46731 RepID=A0A3M6U6W9_POCDA|nr:hypothetical protein pdam_00005818 [Pocillopora damicornis]